MPVIINGSTGVSGVDGTAGTPSVQGTDTNTGMFFPAADTIAFAEGGAEAMRIDSSGSVLVNTTSAPYGEKFVAYVNSTQNAIGARLGPSSSSCTALLATADASASAYDFIGCYSGPTPTIRFRVNSSGDIQFNSGYGSAATAYGCRAWVNFNGVTTVTIRGSGNITSVTRNGTGDYTLNFATAMPDVNYAAKITGGNPGAAFITTSANTSGGTGTEVAPTTSAFRFNMGFNVGSGNVTDTKYAYVVIFR